ncbi:hypothetical protein D3C72_2142290 [compost metagenome]
MGELPAVAQQAAVCAVFCVDVAAVLALPDQGHGAWQGEVQVFCTEQHFGAKGGVDGAADGFTAGAGGARYAALGADQDCQRSLDDRAS